MKWERLERNAASATDPPRASASPGPEMKTWSAYELGRFLDGIRGYRHETAFLLLATTGMRRGEALGLRWADVDLNEGRASIRQTVIAINHEVKLGTPKTNKGRAGRSPSTPGQWRRSGRTASASLRSGCCSGRAGATTTWSSPR